MGSRHHAIAVGAFIVLLGMALVAVVVWLSGYHVKETSYLLVSRHTVSGLRQQATVYDRGVAVGTVESIRFDPDNFRRILVRIAIRPDVRITRGTYALLEPQGITGLSDIELEDHGKDNRPLPTSPQSPGHIPLRPSVFTTLTHSGRTLIKRLSRLARDLDRFATPGNRAHLSQTLANTQAATARLIKLETQIQAALAPAKNLGEDARRTLNNINVVAVRMQSLTDHLDTLTRSATRLSRTGTAAGQDLRDTTLPRLDHLLAEMTAATRSIRKLSTDLDHDPQSLLYGPTKPPAGPGEKGYRKDRQ